MREWRFGQRSGTFVTVVILLIGSVIRLLSLRYVDFRLPFRMGGLYVEFAQQIAAHNYLLPARIPYYTERGIPFAYPPLPFYIQAILLQIFPSAEFTIANLLPPLTAIVALFSFTLLIRALKLQPLIGGFALLAFATLPSAYYEQLESAGLAEAFGSLAAIFLCTTLANVYFRDTATNHIFTGLALGLCVLASPASAYAAVLLFVTFSGIHVYRSKGHRIAAFGRLTGTGVIGLLVASPYLFSLVQNHGTGVVWDVLQAESSSPASNLPFPRWLTPIFNFNASGAPYPFIWNFLVFSGMIWAVFKRQWWLPLWYFLMFAVPREGWWMASIPASFAVGIGMVEFWIPFTSSALKNISGLERGILYAVLAVLFFAYALINVRAIIFEDVIEGYNREYWVNTVEAAQWIKMSTPEDSRFIVMLDKEAEEWAPHLMQRTVLNVAQGAEWEPDKLPQISQLEDDLGDCSDLPCVQQAVEKFTPSPHWYGLLNTRGMQGLSDSEGLQQAGFEVVLELGELVIVRYARVPLP